MEWAEPHLSHHASETTSCVLSLCNTEFESNHFLAVGSNVGGVDLVNLEKREIIATYTEVHSDNVLGVDFSSPFEVLSYDKNKFIKTDTETSDRFTLLDNGSTIFSATHPFSSAPIVVSTSSGIHLMKSLTGESTKICEADNVSELCLLYDTNTLLTVRNDELGVLDIRNPSYIRSLGLSFGVQSMICNEQYLALISNKQVLYTFDLPLMSDSFKEHIPVTNAFPIRPCFYQNLVVVADGSGSIFTVDPNDDDFGMLQIDLDTPVVSITGSESEIAISFEDDIFVYSQLPYEPNLVRATYYEAEEEEAAEPAEGWIAQSEEIKIEEGDCTYEKYGYCDQAIYVCRDCMRESEPFGICEQCAKMCHKGHDVIPIGIRRRFRCDCGNDRARRPCSAMINAKTAINPHNKYGHNFFNRWCSCDGEDTGDMVQCICCSDWFHVPCIGMFPKEQSLPINEIPDFDDWSFVCKKCVDEKLTFLQKIPDKKPDDFLNDFINEASAENGFKRPPQDDKEGIGFSVLGGRWLPPGATDKFVDEPEYKAEFSKLDTTEEDKHLKRASRQAEYVDAMRTLYTGLFQQAAHQGKTVAQASDVREMMSRSVTEMIHRSEREHDNDEQQK